MDNNNAPVTEKNKLSDNQLRIVQFILGILSALALLVSIYLPRLLDIEDSSSILNYSFVIVFIIIMFGRRSVENRYRLRLGLYSLTLMFGILAGIIFFVSVTFYSPEDAPNLSETVKALIIAGMILVLLAGIAVCIYRYFKRKNNGTLSPIRLPEKESNEPDVPDPGVMTIEQKIAEMTRDIDNQKDDKDSD